jgi:hypothetical protein
MIDVKDGHIP